jgi:hypothetical protein
VPRYEFYTLGEDGLEERTVANVTLIKWGGAWKVSRTPTYICVNIAPLLFHVLPRRCFATQQAYDEFWEGLQRLAPKAR